MNEVTRQTVLDLIRQSMGHVPELLRRRDVLWGLRPGTVDDQPGSGSMVWVVFDGSTVPCQVTSLTGRSLPAGTRVMVLRVPPLGNYIIGFVGDVTYPWTSYVTTWSSVSDPQPAIGTGTITGQYLHTPDLVIYTGRILMGATTTYGTGRWQISLPVAAQGGTLHVGTGVIYDASASTGHRPVVAWLANVTSVRFVSTGGDVTATSPITAAASDQLRWTITYRPA